MYKYITYISVLLCLICCKTQRLTGKETNAAVPGSNAVASADDTVGRKSVRPTGPGKHVLNVILRVQGSTAGPLWRIDKVTVTDGFVKNGSQARRPGYMAAYFTDARGQRLDSAFFESPLERRVESPAESNDGKMQTSIRLNEDGAAYIRTNYKENITDVRLYDAKGQLQIVLKLEDHLK